jgi:hypothetical protein
MNRDQNGTIRFVAIGDSPASLEELLLCHSHALPSPLLYGPLLCMQTSSKVRRT